MVHGDPGTEQVVTCLIRLLCLILTPSALTWFSPEAMFLCEAVNSFKEDLKAARGVCNHQEAPDVPLP